jgi:hypothetical protein
VTGYAEWHLYPRDIDFDLDDRDVDFELYFRELGFTLPGTIDRFTLFDR